MKGVRLFVFIILALSFTMAQGISFAEDAAQPVGEAPAAVSPETARESRAAYASIEIKASDMQEAALPPITEYEIQWVWGEVVSLDPQNKQVTINYFDYETDTEKELKLLLDDKTKYENINSLNDLKLHDTISVDYLLSPDGKYNVRNISVEKPEETVTPAEVPAPALTSAAAAPDTAKTAE